MAIFERYANELNKTYLIKGVHIPLLISLGVSIFPTDGKNSKEFLSTADQAMYQSKSEKKGRVVLYQSLSV